MIITRTPFRISFFGGGTDYPAWFHEHGGAVLSTTIDKYCYISCRFLPPFFEHKHRIVYSLIENVRNYDEIQHPAVRNILQWSSINDGLEIHHDGDLPARSGLGSSSSFTVGLINALYALEGRKTNKWELANNAIHIEQCLIKENVGSQDQISAAFGGFNRIEFHHDDSFDVSPIVLPDHRQQLLSDHLMLFFTGFTRFASDIAKSQLKNMKKCETELKNMQSMVDEAIDLLASEEAPIEAFGKLLHESWQYKKSLSDKISTPKLDEIYETAMEAGAIGGKILGAGGGGFLLIFAKPENQLAIRKRLAKLIHVPFKFETSGSRIILSHPSGL